MADKVKVLMLCGPTASGKTALAVMLAAIPAILLGTNQVLFSIIPSALG